VQQQLNPHQSAAPTNFPPDDGLPMRSVDGIDRVSARLVVRGTNAFLTGQVVNAWDNNKPVPGASVTGKSKDGQTFATTTDANGCYSAPVKASGAYTWESPENSRIGPTALWQPAA
jgi:hypothetical protein